MNVLGAYVPLSMWTALILAAGAALSLLLGPALAAGRSWGEAATTWLLVAITLTLSLTLTPGQEDRPPELAACVPHGAADVVRTLAHLGTSSESLLNVLLLMPVGAFAVAASRQARLGVAVSLALPVLIEAWQTVMPGRMCDSADVLANVLGGLMGVLGGVVYVHRARTGVYRP